jgi:hypothetical protein
MQLDFSGSEVDTIALALQLQIASAQNLLLNLQTQVTKLNTPPAATNDTPVPRPSGE